MFQFHNRPSATWPNAALWVAAEIGKHWYGTRNRNPGSRFITYDRLCDIWGTKDWAGKGGQSPFSLLQRFCKSNIDFATFAANVIKLASALIYCKWSGLRDRNFLRHLDAAGFTVSCYDETQHLGDANLPLSDEIIEWLFGEETDGASRFRDDQFAFVPLYIITGSMNYQQCCRGTRMPWEDSKNHEKRDGFYGQVEKVVVVPGYMGPEGHQYASYLYQTEEPARTLACKSIKAPRSNFISEHYKLVKISTNELQHMHIVKHIAAIVIDDLDFKILFAWAWSDLNDFFFKDASEYPQWLRADTVTPKNLLQEVTFLGGALAYLHDSIKLYHMDFKPHNILVFAPATAEEAKTHPLGLWKITDFGLSDFGPSHAATASIGEMIYDSKPVREEGPFQAPEAEVKTNRLDQAKADVWSYGCVATEVLAFALEGTEGVKTFREKRRREDSDSDNHWRDSYFYRASGERSYELVPGIDGYFLDMAGNDYARHTWLQAFWPFFRDMVLSIDPEKRQSAQTCCDQLRYLSAQSILPTYCVFEFQRHTPGSIDETSAPTTPQRSRNSSDSHQSSILSRRHGHRSFDMRTHAQSNSSRDPENRFPFINRLLTYTDEHRSRTLQKELHIVPRSLQNPQLPQLGSPVSPFSRFQQHLFPGRASDVTSNFTDQHLNQATTSSDTISKAMIQLAIPKNLKPSFVVMSVDGSNCILGDKSNLVSASLLGGTSASSLQDVIRQSDRSIVGSLVKAAWPWVVIKEDNKHVVMRRTDEKDPFLSRDQCQTLTGGAELKHFAVSTNPHIGLESANSLSIFTPSEETSLQSGTIVAGAGGWARLFSQPKGNQDFIDLTFDSSGSYVYAVTRDNYYVWQMSGSLQPGYQVRNGQHGVKRQTDPFTPRIIPINGSSDFLLQDTAPGMLNSVYHVDQNGAHSLNLGLQDWPVSSFVCITPDNRSICCVGSQKHGTSRSYSLHHWKLDLSSSPASLSNLRVTSLQPLKSRGFGVAAAQTEMGDIISIVEPNGVLQQTTINS